MVARGGGRTTDGQGAAKARTTAPAGKTGVAGTRSWRDVSCGTGSGPCRVRRDGQRAARRVPSGWRARCRETRRARRYVLAQAAETLHRLGYRGLRAKGLKGRHIKALVAEWRRQGLSDGTVKNCMAHLRWLAKKIGKPGSVHRDNASYGVGARCAT